MLAGSHSKAKTTACAHYGNNRATILRVKGANTITSGNAQPQATKKARVHRRKKPSLNPVFRAVKMPDIQSAINMDMMSAKLNCCFFSLVIMQSLV